jgi:hypothetical protein
MTMNAVLPTVISSGASSMAKGIEVLREHRARLAEELAEIESAIAKLEGSPIQPAEDQVCGVRPGHYAGMEISVALQAYLLERGRGPVPMKRVIRDLAIGDTKTVNKYKDDLDGQARKYVTITIRNNKPIFGFDKPNDVVWLATAEPKLQ